MDDAIRAALDQSQLIEMTTTGAKTGKQRRLEIVLHNFGQRLYISGVPNALKKRGWLANLEALPAFTVGLKGPDRIELPATARVVTDPVERRAILAKVAAVWNRTDLDVMVAYSPLIEVTIDGYPG